MDKNEIIERLERLARCAVHTVGEPPFVMSLDDGIAIREAIDMLRSQPEPHWIPCIERLPERYYNYLITTGDGDTDIGTFTPEFKRWYICDADGFKRTDGVLAWMSLPEPYKGEL